MNIICKLGHLGAVVAETASDIYIHIYTYIHTYIHTVCMYEFCALAYTLRKKTKATLRKITYTYIHTYTYWHMHTQPQHDTLCAYGHGHGHGQSLSLTAMTVTYSHSIFFEVKKQKPTKDNSTMMV